MRMLVERGLHDAVACLEQGIVDRVEDRAGMLERLGDPTTVGVLDYLAAAGEREGVSDEVRIAVIHVAGTIVPGRATADPLAGDLAGSETIVRRLERAREDDRVRAVVLRVDSPGGSALASDLILREVERVRRTRPVVVSMAGTAASGGYYVGMSADRVFADPLSVTGSIGVFVLRPNFAGTFDQLDVNVETYTRGENAALFDPSRPWTAAQRALVQETLDRFYDRFVQRVADGRGLTVEEADAAARGRVWSGERALAAGLVDELGGQAEAIAAAADLAGIDPAVRPRIVTFQPTPGPLDRMLANLLSGERAATLVPLPEDLVEVGRAATRWTVLADGQPQFALPWSLRVR
jgi:protease-4